MAESLSFDRVADRYDATRGYPPAVAASIAKGVARAAGLGAGSEALELGIGTGRIALPLVARGINVTGVDISERMLEQLDAKYAKLRNGADGTAYGRLTVRVADIARLPFKDASFDAVILVHVLHLVKAWRQALDEALRVLRPAGTLLVGQDVHRGRDSARMGDVEDRWRAILRELGFEHANIGAAGYAAILDELRARGLRVEERTVATWETSHTPRQALETITLRTWSGTWTVPDDVFAESARRLTAWAMETYGDRLDQPFEMPHAFKVARAWREHNGGKAAS